MLDNNLKYDFNDGSGEYLLLEEVSRYGLAYALNCYDKDGKWIGHKDIAYKDYEKQVFISENNFPKKIFKTKKELIDEINRMTLSFYDITFNLNDLEKFVEF